MPSEVRASVIALPRSKQLHTVIQSDDATGPWLYSVRDGKGTELQGQKEDPFGYG